jgi:hypothetical protein
MIRLFMFKSNKKFVYRVRYFEQHETHSIELLLQILIGSQLSLTN